MRIISKPRLTLYAQQHPTAKSALEHWHNITKHAHWRDLTQVRAVFPSADPVKVSSGKTVHIFNLKGNAYRLVTAIHYNREKIFVLQFLTHADYSKDQWRESL